MSNNSEAITKATTGLPIWRLCSVAERRRLSDDVALLWLEAPEAVAVSQPGQFVHVAVPAAGHDPFLRRPISIAMLDLDSGRLGLIIRMAGRGTAALAAAKPGDRLDLLGPLGSGFPTPGEGKSLLVGGGIGSAPLFALALAAIAGCNPHLAQTKMLMLAGARNLEELWAKDLAAELGIPALVATDDGSVGHPGLVTDLLQSELSTGSIQSVYACGPVAMLGAVKQLAQSNAVSCYLSLEQRMGCGVGACLGCSWPRSEQAGGGYVRVCRDGPVFAAGEVAI